MSRSLVRLAAGTHHDLSPLTRQLSQYCSRAWAIRQLTVEDAIRRRICQYQHGFTYARSAAMMDDTLTILSLEPKKMVSKTQSQVAESTREVGSPQCARKESGSLRSRSQCPSLCRMSTPPSGTCRTQILTLQTFRQQITCSPTCRKRLEDCQRKLLPRRPILPSTSESTAPLRISLGLILL